jgi:N-glycosylase/DNA lyase
VIDTKDIKCFDAAAIADSGQVFRAEIKPDGVHFISGNEYAIVKDGEIASTNDSYFVNYFDLAGNYENIKQITRLPQNVKDECCGIRILRGDIAEIIISFIISANNNIKRIRGTIKKMCEQYGKRRINPNGDEYFTFPALENLATVGADDFKALGCGYRAGYLVKTVKALQTADLREWQKLNNGGLYERLISLHGVGDKVARCIMLFAFHRLDIIPVDTWIIKTAGNFVDIRGKTPKNVAVELQAHFGQFGGIAQQYIFYYTQFLRRALDGENAN